MAKIPAGSLEDRFLGAARSQGGVGCGVSVGVIVVVGVSARIPRRTTVQVSAPRGKVVFLVTDHDT